MDTKEQIVINLLIIVKVTRVKIAAHVTLPFQVLTHAHARLVTQELIVKLFWIFAQLAFVSMEEVAFKMELTQVATVYPAILAPTVKR